MLILEPFRRVRYGRRCTHKDEAHPESVYRVLLLLCTVTHVTQNGLLRAKIRLGEKLVHTHTHTHVHVYTHTKREEMNFCRMTRQDVEDVEENKHT